MLLLLLGEFYREKRNCSALLLAVGTKNKSAEQSRRGVYWNLRRGAGLACKSGRARAAHGTGCGAQLGPGDAKAGFGFWGAALAGRKASAPGRGGGKERWPRTPCTLTVPCSHPHPAPCSAPAPACCVLSL